MPNRPMFACLIAALSPLFLLGCDAPKEAKRVDVAPELLKDVPNVLRGTIGAEANFRGIEPVLVSGLGIVVGLRGTGGADNMDPAIQTTMERDISRGGIGRGGAGSNYPGMEGMTPAEFLRSRDVAVVIVEARIAPGSPEGSVFDVFVRTLPGSGVTSLEGGSLWTTDMRLGQAAVFGAVKARSIAEARGPLFINPFSDSQPTAAGEVKVTRTTGRVLGGGRVTQPLQIEMVLDNDSHARARSIVSAINSRFPMGPGDDGQTARGRGSGSSGTGAAGTIASQSIALRVPMAYSDRPAEFLQLIRHLRVDNSMQDEFARRYVEELKSQPGLAEEIRWCLQAVGRPAVPFLPPLYDYPEIAPKLAGLAAGARLGDARAAGPLIDLAKSGAPGLRSEALRLLGEMPANPAINLALRELVSNPDLDVRVAAYEGLRKRGDQLLVRLPVGPDPRQPRFSLEILPANEPMVYITQQGEPRIVLFGGLDLNSPRTRGSGKYRGIMLQRPLLVSSQDDRLMMAADSPTEDVRVRYRDGRTNQSVTAKAPLDLGELIEFMAHTPTPEDPRPGLGMSYSEVVGAIYDMSRQGAFNATFATEEDKLRAEIFEASQVAIADRPETPAAANQADAMFKPLAPKPLSSEAPSTGERKSRVVPLAKPKPKKN